MLGPTIETARLILRPPTQADLPGWIAFAADPECARFVGGVQPEGMAWRSLAAMAGSWALQGFGMFSLIEKSSGDWVGRVGPWRPHGWPGSEVGWGLARAAWGKGYALEAAAASMNFAVDVLGWDEVIHCIDPANTPSQAVALRLGSNLRGRARLPAPLENEPIEVWGQSAATWRARSLSQ